MKRFLIICFAFISFSGFAQHTAQEIKKFKINKVTKIYVTQGSDAVQKTEIWYDEKGNDTSQYSDGKLYQNTKYEYDPKGKIIKRVKYGADGNEMETAVYTYKTDGSYTISNTDKSFGMTDYTYCDKAGKTTKTVAPDRSERIYTYDPKGRLIRVKSKPSDNGGVVVDLQYAYNAKGQMIKEMNKGDYKWNATYTYKPTGLIEKSKSITTTDGVADPEVTVTYEYELRK